MADHVYKTIEITGTASDGQDQAIRNALAKATKTVKHMRWFQVIETRGSIDDGKVDQFQVTLKIGFRLED